MTIAPNTTQRDLVMLAVLVCGDRPSAKFRPAAKGSQNSTNADPTRGYDR
jgi:hypothetical protein